MKTFTQLLETGDRFAIYIGAALLLAAWNVFFGQVIVGTAIALIMLLLIGLNVWKTKSI